MSILVTGGTSFIAMHVIDLLVSKGHDVVYTVRSQDKAKFVRDKFPNGKLHYEIVEDIMANNAFDHVIQNRPDIKYVLHMASPFFQAKNDPENELLFPALHGTRNILQAIKQFGPQIEHVCITSSFAAILNSDREPDPSLTYTEESWNPITWETAVNDLKESYIASKKFAEKEFWRFIEEEKPNFTGSTVNPPLVFGAMMHSVSNPDSINTSNKIVYNLLHAKSNDEIAGMEEGYFGYVDVRDVARAHVHNVENPEESAGKRRYTTPGYYHPQLVLDIIHNNFPSLNDKVPKGKPFSEKEMKDVLEKKFAKIDNSQTNKELGLGYHSMDDTIVETVRSMIDHDKRWGTSV